MTAFFGATAKDIAVDEGQTFVLTKDDNKSDTYVTAHDGATIAVSDSTLYARICADGNLMVSNTTSKVFDNLWFCNGIRVVMTNDPNATLTIARAKQIEIGRSAVVATHGYPPIDVTNLRFAEPESTGILLGRKVTVRKLPAGHSVRGGGKGSHLSDTVEVIQSWHNLSAASG